MRDEIFIAEGLSGWRLLLQKVKNSNFSNQIFENFS